MKTQQEVYQNTTINSLKHNTIFAKHNTIFAKHNKKFLKYIYTSYNLYGRSRLEVTNKFCPSYGHKTVEKSEASCQKNSKKIYKMS